MAQVRNTPSQQPSGTTSQGSRAGSQAGTRSERTGLADQDPQEPLEARGNVENKGGEQTTQGLAGAQGSGGGAERGISGPRDKSDDEQG
jgi:hypothetical protein